MDHILETNAKGGGIEIKDCTFEMSFTSTNDMGGRHFTRIPETYITKEHFEELKHYLDGKHSLNPRITIILKNPHQQYTYLITMGDYIEMRTLLTSYGIPSWTTVRVSNASAWQAMDRIADLVDKVLTF